MVVLPHGTSHQLFDTPDSKCLPGEHVIAAYRSGDSLFGGVNENFDIVCGYFEYDRSWPHPLIKSLPNCIHLHQKERG
ncbi:hypothetical protein EIZ48_20100 [Photobacterium alginatilyticum]|uniref:AraC-type transcription regulator ligand-binding domain-containing protein n=1 Tax=Photobacterium alginatilyticum TaxID=1775171 RepID=A0ABW9YLT9_9GAMM|nr:hypothetical protein [Photobacterium alginatilyticum]